MNGRKFLYTVLTALALLLTAVGGSACFHGDLALQESRPEDASRRAESSNYNIVWYLGGAPQEDESLVFDMFSRMAAERIPGTTVTVKIVEWVSYTEKMRIVMASQEKWDMCFTSDWANHFEPAVTRDAYAEISKELLERSGRGILDVLPNEVWSCVTIDDKILAVPMWQIHCMTRAFGVKKDLYDKYKDVFDFDAVRCKKDMEPFFDLVLEHESGITPFLPEVNTFGTPFDYNKGITFERVGNGMVVRMDDPTFTVQRYLDQPEVREMLDLMRRWYLKGYIAKDASIVNDWSGEQRSGKYAAFEEGNAKPDNAAEFTSIAYPIVDVQFTDSYASTAEIRHGMFGYSKTSADLERCIKLTNLMFTDADMYQMLNHGIEDIHYKIREDQTLETLNERYNPGIDWELGNNALAYPRLGQGLDVYDRTRERNASAIHTPLFGFSFDSTPVKNQAMQVQAIYEEIYPLLNTGTMDPAVFIEDANERMDRAGFQDLIAEAQRQVNRWLEKGANRDQAEARVRAFKNGRNGKL